MNTIQKVKLLKSFSEPKWAAGNEGDVKEYPLAYAEYLIETGYAELENGNGCKGTARKAVERKDAENKDAGN